MKTQSKILLYFLVLLVFLNSGCMSARLGSGVPKGLLFSNLKGPSYCALRERAFVYVYDDAVSSSASAHKVTIPAPYTFGSLSFSWGDISNQKMLDGIGIKQIEYVDYESFNILNIYERGTLTIYGK